jgi:hypothetical protein
VIQKSLKMTKSKVTGVSVALVICLLGIACSYATPIKPQHVPANPAWVLHLDWAAARSTALGQFFLSELNEPDSRAKLAEFDALFKLDSRKEVRGITLFNTGTESSDGTLLLYVDYKPDRLAAIRERVVDYQSSRHGKFVIQSWIDEKKGGRKAQKHRVYAAMHPAGILIFSQSRSSVVGALDVIEKSAPNLSSNPAFAKIVNSNGAPLVDGAAGKLDARSSDPGAAIFKLAKMIRLQIYESDRHISATLNLDVDDENVATRISGVAHALISLLTLQSGKPEVSKIADAISLKRDGGGVSAILDMPADELVAMLKAATDRKEKAKAKNN